MNITSREKVRAAFKRASDLGCTDEEALAATAQALAIPIKAARECIGFCCERGEQQQVSVCDECTDVLESWRRYMRRDPVDEDGADSEGGETDYLLETAP